MKNPEPGRMAADNSRRTVRPSKKDIVCIILLKKKKFIKIDGIIKNRMMTIWARNEQKKKISLNESVEGLRDEINSENPKTNKRSLFI